MKLFSLTLQGTNALLMHNPRMVDPNYEITRQIKALTAKRKKTDEDLKDIERLEWFGGLYEENGVIVQPTSKVKKCMVETAKVMRLGKGIERCVSFHEINVPLIFPQKDLSPTKLWEYSQKHDDLYVNRASVGVNKKRVMRVRPEFKDWAMTLEGTFITDAGVNYDDLQQIVKLAGSIEGIGDNRVNGYGRFKAELKEIK